MKLGTGAEPRLLFFGEDGAPRDPAHAGQTDQQTGGDGAGEPHPAAIGALLSAGFFLREALLPAIAADADDFGEDIMGELDALNAPAVLEADEAAGNEGIDQRASDRGEFEGRLEGEVITKARLREEVVLDEGAHPLGEIGDAALVKIGEDFAAVTRDQVDRDLRLTELFAPLVELAADDTEKGGLDLELGEALGGAAAGTGDEFDDPLLDAVGEQRGCGAGDDFEGLGPIETPHAHAVLQNGAHLLLETLELGQEILAQAEDHLAGRFIEGVGRGIELAALEAGAQSGGRTVLDEVGELGEEGAAAVAPGLVGAAEGENLFELIEGEDGSQEPIFGAPDIDILAMKIFPERFLGAGGGGIGLGVLVGGEKGGLDLIGERGSLRTVVEAEVEWQEILLTEDGKGAGLQEGRFAEARLAKEDG